MHQRLCTHRRASAASVLVIATMGIAISGCAPADAEGGEAAIDAESRYPEVRHVRRGIDAVDTARGLTSEFNARSADAMSVLDQR